MKKKKFIFMVGFLVSSVSALAAETIPAGEIALPDNFLTNALQPLLEKVSLLVGGIFGIYIILTLMQFFRERKKIRLLQDIRNDLDLLTKHFGVKHSHPKRGLFRRLLGMFGSEEEENKKGRK